MNLIEQALHQQYFNGQPIRFKRRFFDFPKNDLVVRDVDGVRSRCYMSWGNVIVDYYAPFETQLDMQDMSIKILFGCWKYNEENNTAVQYEPATMKEKLETQLWVNGRNFENIQRAPVVHWGMAIGSKPYAFFELENGTVVGMYQNQVFIAIDPDLTNFSDWAANL